jgi:hypothetical protein
MGKRLAVAMCVVVGGLVITQWPEIERYGRVRAM